MRDEGPGHGPWLSRRRHVLQAVVENDRSTRYRFGIKRVRRRRNAAGVNFFSSYRVRATQGRLGGDWPNQGPPGDSAGRFLHALVCLKRRGQRLTYLGITAISYAAETCNSPGPPVGRPSIRILGAPPLASLHALPFRRPAVWFFSSLRPPDSKRSSRLLCACLILLLTA